MAESAKTTQQPEAPAAPATPPVAVAPVTTVATPSLIAQTNAAKAVALRAQYANDLAQIGNNMSAKIRFLHTNGLSMGDISRVLQIQFQFVRNVVQNYKDKVLRDAAKAAAAAPAAVTTPTAPVAPTPPTPPVTNS